MNLAELTYKRFAETGSLTKHLAEYAGHPAIFNPEPPEDGQDGWDGKTQYPMVIFHIDMQANEERNSSGTLTVSLVCQNTDKVSPENIETEIRKCLRDVLLKADGGILYAFAWARTDAFSMPEAKKDLLLGCDISFDILEYAIQETTDPDPVMAAGRYIKGLYPEFTVIGMDQFGEITEASDDAPVIYCRLISLEKAEETNTVAWMDGRLAIHILCPDVGIRTKIAAAVVNRMSLDGEIIMLDKSPMTVKGLQANYKSDYLKDGQIFFIGHYGLLRYKPKGHTIKQAEYTNMETGGGIVAKADTERKMNGQTKAADAGQEDPVYTIEEYAANAEELFHTRPECVIAALKEKNITECGKAQAEKIINAFNKREVG
jgi:hypothetical protein